MTCRQDTSVLIFNLRLKTLEQMIRTTASDLLRLPQLFSRNAARILYSNQRLQRWCFDVELLYLAQKCGIPVSEVAVTWTEIPGERILTRAGATNCSLRYLSCVPDGDLSSSE